MFLYSCMKKIIYANNANVQIKGWDGVVGDVPDDVKKSLLGDMAFNFRTYRNTVHIFSRLLDDIKHTSL